jgi:uncharacterized protein YbjT (DUF2867 family)
MNKWYKMERTALVFGSTGLVGRHLVNELTRNPEYSKIICFVRKLSEESSLKVEEVLTDFSNPSGFESKIYGDTVFICLGTTIKKAGSIEMMEYIDRDIPVKVAQIAQNSGVKRIAVISSIGANEHSRNYYLRIKGEMEHGIRNIDFENIVIARPSLIIGKRKEKRPGDIIAKIILRIFSFILIGKLRKYRGIQARTIAKAIINILAQDLQEVVYESDELEELGQ